ncbi:MAG: hypothetical protein JO250_14790 [Armatimonadetes bacterium]|nr:hypothetical protein [Armatimonadota bacterium]
MRNRTLLVAGLGGLAMLGGVRPGHAQVVPGDIDKTNIRPSAHALGLGGSYLLLGDDSYGVIFNPAAAAQARQAAGLGLAAEGQTSNINIGDVTKLVDRLKTLRDQINNNPNNPNNLQGAQGAFNDVYNFATAAGASGASPARLTGSVSAGIGGSGGGLLSVIHLHGLSFGAVAYGGVSADARITAQTLGDGSRNITINGGAVGLTSIGIPVAYLLPNNAGTVGLTPKIVRADYAGFNDNATENATQTGGSITGAAFGEVNSQQFDLDAGYISPTLTVSPAPGAPPVAVQGALVVRHILSPSFSLAKNINNASAGFQDTAPANFNFSLHPEVDLGAGASAYGARLVGEVHNIGGENGGGHTFHVGAEYTAFKYVVPRIGYDNDRFVYGLGLNFGPLRFNAAAGTDPQQRAAADLSLNFGL